MIQNKKIIAQIEQLLVCLEGEIDLIKNNFMKSLITRCLYSARSFRQATSISDKLLDDILREKDKDWTWNYNISSNKDSSKGNYPNDMDDTFCALNAISLWRKDLIVSKVFSCITKNLINNETAHGGPYKTWITNDVVWHDVDPWVNANIGAFLNLYTISLPALENYLEDIILVNKAVSKYYLSEISLYYFLSFWYQKQKGLICSKIINKQNKDGSFDSLILTAFSVCTLIRMNGIDDSVKKGIDFINRNSLFHNENIFYVEKREDITIYADSKAFTIAICIEALSLYLNLDQQTEEYSKEIIYINKVKKNVKNNLGMLPKDISRQILTYSDYLLSKDSKNEIILLPCDFTNSLNKNSIKEAELIKLSTANVFGWCAYNIYDEYIDSNNKKGVPLALANLFFREMILLYNKLGLEDSIIRDILNRVEEAYFSEQVFIQQKEQLSKVKDKALYNKSIGHILPIIYIMVTNGHRYDSVEIKACLRFFENYLFVRQLSDDAHDWEEDMQNNINTQITVDIYKYSSEPNNSSLNKQIFWEKISQKVANKIIRHNSIAKSYIKLMEPCFSDISFLSNLIQPYENIANEIISEKKKMLDFIDEMNKK